MNTILTNNEKLNLLLPGLERRIRESFGSKVKQIILYGSYARGDYDSESDVDIMVVVDDENLSYYRKLRNEIVSDLFGETGFLFSITIDNLKIFSEYQEVIPFYSNVVGEGKIIYG